MISSNTKEAANETLRDAKTTAYSAKRDFGAMADDFGNEFAHTARNAGKQIRGFIDTASEQLSDASEKVTTEIRSNPVRSSALALGIGVILGALLRR
jgi:hypothetical protein